MAMPLLPASHDKRRIARRPRTADIISDDGSDMALGASAAAPAGSNVGAPTHGGDPRRKSRGVGAPQSTAWGANDSDGSDTDLEDEEFMKKHAGHLTAKRASGLMRKASGMICLRQGGRDAHVNSARSIYHSACKKYGVLPSSQVLSCIATETINLTNRNLSAKDATALSCALLHNTDVTGLILRGNRIGAAGIRAVCGMMDENVYIVTLDVSDNQLGRAGAAELGSMLKVNEELRVLRAAGNKFQEKDAIFIAESLQHNYRLAELDLSNNNLQEEGGVAMGQALTTTDTLLNLNLSWNHLRYRGAVAIASGLQANSSLTHLNLSWNGFSDGGAKAISDALKDNINLIDLDLTSNRITAIGAASLSEGVTANNTLQVFRIGLNPLSSVGAVKILEALRQNETSSIKTLDMKEVSVTFEFEALINEIQKTRDIKITRGMTVSTHDHMAGLISAKPVEIILSEPIHLFMVHVKLKKMQLWDYFVRFDEQLSMRVNRSHFIQSCQASRIPMSPQQLDQIVEYLDPKNEDFIDYGLLLKCQTDPILKAKRQIARSRMRSRSASTSDNTRQQQNSHIRPLTSVEPQESRLSRPVSPVRPNTSVSSIPPQSMVMPTES